MIDAAVPIRLPSVMAAKIDPVIFQFYKSFACFSTSWLVLLYMVCILQVLSLSVLLVCIQQLLPSLLGIVAVFLLLM